MTVMNNVGNPAAYNSTNGDLTLRFTSKPSGLEPTHANLDLLWCSNPVYKPFQYTTAQNPFYSSYPSSSATNQEYVEHQLATLFQQVNSMSSIFSPGFGVVQGTGGFLKPCLPSSDPSILRGEPIGAGWRLYVFYYWRTNFPISGLTMGSPAPVPSLSNPYYSDNCQNNVQLKLCIDDGFFITDVDVTNVILTPQ